jgi:23S rRNA pseudouridine1911/1915/1917 synthase
MDNNNPEQIYKLTANQDDAGTRLDKFIATNIQDLSRSRVKSLIESGHLKINGTIIKDCSLSVKQLVEYELEVPSPTTSAMQATKMSIDVVYEDDHMLVINKPAGLTVHPGAGNYQDTLANGLLHYCKDNLSGIGGVERPGIVHRLDKDTSGLMVVAKNDTAHRKLSKQLSTRELSRIYLAIVWGVPSPAAGTIKVNLARSVRDRTKIMAVRAGGREAITHYKMLKNYHDMASLIECKLETGRTHQIRVHLSHKGHALLGDQSYGNNSSKYAKIAKVVLSDFKRQALHSTKIGFIHPATGDYMQFEVPVPEDMAGLIKALKELE